tara:strand:- start:980 stop:1255 length:276 start_codon:yes stop_codon:yes gene_type:complete
MTRKERFKEQIQYMTNQIDQHQKLKGQLQLLMEIRKQNRNFNKATQVESKTIQEISNNIPIKENYMNMEMVDFYRFCINKYMSKKVLLSNK